jgi:type I restriction enzyme S subunit
MTEWRETTTAALLKQGAIEIGDGYRAKNAEFVDDGGLPFVRVGDVGSTIRLEGTDQLPSELADKYGRKVSRAWDSLITMKGTIGRVAYVSAALPPFVYSPQISYWRSLAPEWVNPRWLRYWLESPEFVAQALATKGATDMADYINLRDQRRMRITLPPPDVQARIAAVLGAIDDLIENCRSRIDVLEWMAQAVYREWFVRFRFPGYEDSTCVDSSLGRIPDGWDVVPLAEVASVDKGLSYMGVHLDGRGMPMANLKCVLPGGGFRREGTKPYSGAYKDKHRITSGDLIMANTDLTQAGAVIGSPAFIPRAGFAGGGIIWHHLFAIRCTDPAVQRYLYWVFRGETFRNYARGVASGTTVLGFRPVDLLAFELLRPSGPVLAEFARVAEDLAVLAEDIEESIDYLAAIRDLLLPKLVSGQIDVSRLDLDAVGVSAA